MSTEHAPPPGASPMVLSSLVEDPHRPVTVTLQHQHRVYLLGKVFSSISNLTTSDMQRVDRGHEPEHAQRIAALRDLVVLLEEAT